MAFLLKKKPKTNIHTHPQHSSYNHKSINESYHLKKMLFTHTHTDRVFGRKFSQNLVKLSFRLQDFHQHTHTRIHT